MNATGIRKKVLVCAILFLTISFPFMAVRADETTAPAPAAPDDACKPTATFSADILSQYIFRGAALSKDSAVIQPAATITWNGFSATIWGNFDTDRHSNNPFLPLQEGITKWSETDLTLSYTKEICPNFSILVGNIYYGLQPPLESPNGQDEDELFGGVSYAFPWFTVAFTAYGEVIHTVDEWFQLDLTKSIPVDCLCKGATLDFGASFGYLILNHENNLLNLAGNLGSYSDFHTCQLTADIKFPINKYVSVSPKVGYWLPLTDSASDYLQANSLDSSSMHFYGGVNVTATF